MKSRHSVETEAYGAMDLCAVRVSKIIQRISVGKEDQRVILSAFLLDGRSSLIKVMEVTRG